LYSDPRFPFASNLPFFYKRDMEHPHEDYHVRPYPQQPKRGGKELVQALRDLEEAIEAEVPDLERLRNIQARIHASSASFNDDKLVDRLRTLSSYIDQYLGSPQKSVGQKLAQQVLQILIELKHL